MSAFFSNMRVLWALILCGGSFCGAEGGTKADNSSVLVVDPHYVIDHAKAMQDVRSQIEQLRAHFHKEISAAENLIRKLSQSLQKASPKEAQVELINRRREIEEKTRELQSLTDMRKKQTEIAFTDGLKRIQEGFSTILADIATKNKSMPIFERKAVIYCPQQSDLTQEVLARLDKSMPRLKTNVPSEHEVTALMNANPINGVEP